ncbi:MAG: hypothetical protein AAF388_24080 [Bacteroidota bacterium]
MLTMRHILMITLLAILCVNQTTAQPKQGDKFEKDSLRFFLGDWSGQGEFSDGRKIEADVSFSYTLDSSWISYKHVSRLPFTYKASSMWRVDPYNGQFLAYTFDNIVGHRIFRSNGWKEDKLVLTSLKHYPNNGLYFEHYIFERLTEDSFRMTYESSNDGINWKLGDFLLFKKN